MSDETHDILLDEDGLKITLVTGDDARIELESEGLDLSVEDDVVVVVDGVALDVKVESTSRAHALLPELSGEVDLLVRVHERFEGWVLEL